MFLTKNKKIQQIFALFLLKTFLVSSLFLPHYAQAQEPVIDTANIFQTTISAVSSAGSLIKDGFIAASTFALKYKELVSDPLVWGIINVAIERMTADIVDWINNGFDGNPAFVTNLGGFFEDLADDIVGSFIEGSELGFLCDPFELDIRIALLEQHARGFDVSCRLSDVVDNIDDFIEGDFASGGWDGWYELSVNDNPYKNFLEADQELQRLLTEKTREKKLELGFGRGFLNFKDQACVEENKGDPNNICEVLTPGAVLETGLEKALGLPADRLVIADEFNEIAYALLNQLVSQVFSSGGGLRGASRSSYGDSSLIDQLVADVSQISALTVNIETALVEENGYKDAVGAGIIRLEAIKALNDTLALRNDTQKQSAASVFALDISIKEKDYASENVGTENNIANLEDLLDAVNNAKTPSEIGSYLQSFSEIQARGELHTELDSQNIKQELDSLESQIKFELAT